ncbi:MAG: ATP-binding protein [Alphaproteobacteria bacterium]|nr:ATP-binding protein [Alphaproteobacteria bacterium]
MALLCGTLTLLILTFLCLGGFFSFGLSPIYFYVLVCLDGIALCYISYLIVSRLAALDRKQKKFQGILLQRRISFLFALLSVIPTSLVMILSVVFFSYGMQDWFNIKVQTAVNESLVVARSYLEEHKSLVGRDARLMAQDLSNNWYKIKEAKDRKTFMEEYLHSIGYIRSLTEAIIFNEKRDVLGKGLLTFALEFEPVPLNALESAKNGEVVILTSPHHDRVRALLRVNLGGEDLFLFVGRSIDKRVLVHLENTEKSVGAYNDLERQHTGFQLIFITLFLLGSIVLVLISVWMGMNYADQLTRPVRALMRSAARVASGSLSERVPLPTEESELSLLSRSFNSMLATIQKQQKDLMRAQQTLAAHNEFISTTLQGVSSGVLRVDAHNKVTYYNTRAHNMCMMAGIKLRSKHKLNLLMPVLTTLLRAENFEPSSSVSTEIMLGRRVLRVRIVAEKKSYSIKGYIITLDDMTDLLSAQKQSAWADVARRIAHEVKNPLTPIQLCVERLRNKYDSLEKHVIEKYVDTIQKQVTVIERLISDFASFARWPAPNKRQTDILLIMRQNIVAIGSMFNKVRFNVHVPDQKRVMFFADSEQISQLFSNVLKNACQAMMEGGKEEGEINIVFDVVYVEGRIVIHVDDSGPGFPANIIEGLMSPYVTTRRDGTGLGLAICRKIVEDHGGNIQLQNHEKGGRVVINFLAEI